MAAQALAYDDAEHQITQVMTRQFEKPEAALTVLPVSVEGDYAVAGWLQGTRGGRALLKRDKNHWAIAVCGGSGLTQASVLQSIGMQGDAAARLAAAVVAAEGKLGADKRKLFDGFEGMVKVNAAQGHAGHSEHAPK
ncbi:hypothetical protein DIC66_19820 [Rhodoferax lacus]|uniref:Copper uptake system-associated protein n=2 Tax=Rhodoferax lacus TaxID=2184758 RepID=A0A3E1R8Z0_9BURK|nr:hypothetical protein DIC66_19820 [Rhodoferax lacus]